MSELILHHYDFSSFSEKIRLILGAKKLAWRSVIIPPKLPKPLLMPLTGGYRRTPVLQIGADIWCDTRLIARELERRVPEPTLLPDRYRGQCEATTRWAEELLFWPIARYVSGINASTMPAGVQADRAAMRGLPPPSPDRLLSSARRNRGQMLLQIGWLENLLADGRTWLLGSPGATITDLAAYHGLWFLGRLAIDLSGDLVPFAHCRSWMRRIAALGHGSPSDMSAEQALEIAAAATPAVCPESHPGEDDPRPGMQVSVRPEEAFGRDPVVGELAFIDEDELALRRHDPQVGEILVHFPRLKYVVKALS